MHADEYPELSKMSVVNKESQIIGAFLDMELPAQGLYLCEWNEELNRMVPTPKSIENILATYFDIDLEKADLERRRMLEEIRNKA